MLLLKSCCMHEACYLVRVPVRGIFLFRKPEWVYFRAWGSLWHIKKSFSLCSSKTLLKYHLSASKYQYCESDTFMTIASLETNDFVVLKIFISSIGITYYALYFSPGIRKRVRGCGKYFFRWRPACMGINILALHTGNIPSLHVTRGQN